MGSSEQRGGYFGARAGFGVTTALGPVVIEFGSNDHGRYNVWFRFRRLVLARAHLGAEHPARRGGPRRGDGGRRRLVLAALGAAHRAAGPPAASALASTASS